MPVELSIPSQRPPPLQNLQVPGIATPSGTVFAIDFEAGDR